MALETVKSLFGIGRSGTDPTPPEPELESETTEENDTTDSETNFPSRPPGWEPLYGSYKKPVFPTDDRELTKYLEAVNTAGEVSDVDLVLPEVGTNLEHIKLHIYTVAGEEQRTLVIDVHISQFSEWLPEEKGDYEYPEDGLSQNGPYYMHLNNNLTDMFNLSPFAFTLVDSDADADIAIFSAEKAVFQKND